MEAVQNKRVPQKVRRHPESGKAQRGIERLRAGAVPGVASLTLGRFYSVDLLPKLGVYVYGKLQILEDDTSEESIQQIYDDLWPCYVRYHLLHHGCEPVKNYIDTSGLIDGFALMLALLSQMMGNYAQIDVVSDYDGVFGKHKYYFVAYQQCFHEESWHVIAIGPTIKKLARSKSEDLHTFLLFLHAFEPVNIDTWYQGSMLWILDDQMPCEIDELSNEEPETVQQLKSTLQKYKYGYPATVRKMISAAFTHTRENGFKYVDLDDLERINEGTQNEPIKAIITEGLKVLRMGKSLYEYSYLPQEYEDCIGLSFDNQFTIVWDIGDMLSGHYEDYINAEANEGVFCPNQSLTIKPDCNRLFIPDQFTRVLTNFFDSAVTQMNLFTEPKKKKNARNTK